MASKQFLACVLTKCFTNVHDHFREAVTQSRAVNLHLCRWIFVKNSDRTWKSVLFCFVFFFPTTRKWKLSVKKKTEIELKYFSMLFFRDMYIASFFFSSQMWTQTPVDHLQEKVWTMLKVQDTSVFMLFLMLGYFRA